MMPLSPEPRLSAAATPIKPIVMPPPPPDLDEAHRQLMNGLQPRHSQEAWRRDLLERELLGQAMGTSVGLEALRSLDPAEFYVPLNQNVAGAILDLADQGLAHDGAAVTEELRRRPLSDFPPDVGEMREARDREFLASVIGDPEKMAQLSDMRPEMISTAYRGTAGAMRAAILDLVETDREVTRLSVQAEMDQAGSGYVVPAWAPPQPGPTQLPAFLDPTKQGARHPDLRTFGLSGWQHAAFAADSTAYPHAREIRAYTRRDLGVAAARTAVRQYRQALEVECGRVVDDGVGDVTRELAEQLVSIPKALTIPDRPVVDLGPNLGLPDRPQLSAAGRAALRR